MSADPDKKNPGPFGVLLRRWRRIRGISQLGLAYLSNTSPRHISFLETGRARPGKELILELAQSLRLSLRDANSLMLAAGFPHVYPEDKLAASQDMAPFRALINNLVHGNSRLPCFVVDRWWRIQDVNCAMRALFKGLGTSYKIPDDQDVIDRILGEDSQTSRMINFEEIARQFVVRLRSEVTSEDADEEIEKLARKAESRIKHNLDNVSHSLSSLPLAMCPRYQIGDDVYSAVVGISRFGAAPHVELSELRLIWLMPADESSEMLLRRLMAESPESLNEMDLRENRAIDKLLAVH